MLPRSTPTSIPTAIKAPLLTRNYDASTNYEVDPVLWEIRRERMVELFGQGFSFYDIRRWHKAPTMSTVSRVAPGSMHPTSPTEMVATPVRLSTTMR